MSSQGGDVFKFAGDAILVVWPPSDEDVVTTARRAAQCALEIKDKLTDVPLAANIRLNIKIGVGVGDISILHVGGVFGRVCERWYLDIVSHIFELYQRAARISSDWRTTCASV